MHVNYYGVDGVRDADASSSERCLLINHFRHLKVFFNADHLYNKGFGSVLILTGSGSTSQDRGFRIHDFFKTGFGSSHLCLEIFFIYFMMIFRIFFSFFDGP